MTQPRVAPPLRLSCAGGGDVMRLLARGLRGTSTGQAPFPATQRPNVRYPSLSRPVWRREAGCPSGQRERSVKPSAQPTQVRTLDLPPPAKTARDRGILRVRGPSCFVSSSVIVGQQTPLHHAGYGHIADGSGAGGAVHRTACSSWPTAGCRPELSSLRGLGGNGCVGTASLG